MLHSVRSVSGIIVVINLISVINNYCITSTIMSTIITSMVIIIIMTINSNRHYRKSGKIRWIISVMIRWIIGHIDG